MVQQINYQDLIDELKDEVGTGSLSNKEIIQILRSKNPEKDGYHQIIDWYYNDKAMTIELAPDSSDSKEDAKDKLILRDQYFKDKPNLEEIEVETCLNEMFKKNVTKSKKNNNPFF